MINDDEIVFTLAELISFGHAYKYTDEVIMKRISYSSYFTSVENNKDNPVLYIDTRSLIDSVYQDVNAAYDKIKVYKESLWLGELYLKIQRKTKMTFEAIFLYLPLNKGYEMFPVYHEMDYSQGVDYFVELVQKQSILSIVMKKKKLSVEEVSKASELSYQMISALKTRKKDIKKVAAFNLLLLADYIGVKPETLVRVFL